MRWPLRARPATAVLCAVFLALLLAVAAREWKKSVPLSCRSGPCNVILVVVDALSARHLGLYGYDRETSPFIDAYFGTKGVVFTNAWSGSSWTTPSFASLFTSLEPEAHGVEQFGVGFSSGTVTFPPLLRAQGVTIAAFAHPRFQSTEEIYKIFEARERFQISESLDLLLAGEWLASEGRELVAEKRPFFVFVHSLTVHDPYDPPPAYRGYFEAPAEYPGPVSGWDILAIKEERRELTGEEAVRFRRQYDQDVRYFDDLFKAFIGSVPEEVLAESVVILTADHGEAFGEHGKFHHGAATLYEEVLHIPLLMRFPDEVPEKVVPPVSFLDLGPTILELFGLPPQESFTGLSLLPLREGGRPPVRVLRVQELLDKEDTGVGEGERARAARAGNWKLIRNPDASLELYDLADDPGETQNRVNEIPLLPPADREAVQALFESLEVSLP